MCLLVGVGGVGQSISGIFYWCAKKAAALHKHESKSDDKWVSFCRVHGIVAQFLMPDFVQWINRIKGMGVSLLFCKKTRLKSICPHRDLIFQQKLTLCVDNLV